MHRQRAGRHSGHAAFLAVLSIGLLLVALLGSASPASGKPRKTASPQPTVAATAAPSPTATPTPAPTSTPAPTPTATPAPTPTPTPPASAAGETENLVAIANVQATEPCWTQIAEGGLETWTTTDWTSESCRYDIYESRFLKFEFQGQYGGTITNSYEIEPHTCGLPDETTVTATTTWTLIRNTSETCVYRWARYEHGTVGPPDSVTLSSNEWYWSFVPLTSASQTVAFTYDGKSWTYWQDGSNCCVDTGPPADEGGEGF